MLEQFEPNEKILARMNKDDTESGGGRRGWYARVFLVGCRRFVTVCKEMEGSVSFSANPARSQTESVDYHVDSLPCSTEVEVRSGCDSRNDYTSIADVIPYDAWSRFDRFDFEMVWHFGFDIHCPSKGDPKRGIQQNKYV